MCMMWVGVVTAVKTILAWITTIFVHHKQHFQLQQGPCMMLDRVHFIFVGSHDVCWCVLVPSSSIISGRRERLKSHVPLVNEWMNRSVPIIGNKQHLSSPRWSPTIAKNQLFTFLMKKCFFLPITKKAGRRAQYLYENKTKKKKREGKTATTSVPRHRATARTNDVRTNLVRINT